MNLHIVPDSKFTDRFYSNLPELGVTAKNKFVVRSNEGNLNFIKHDLPFAKLYSDEFNARVGDTSSYEKVFIHQFSPLMYRWVALNSFRELNWCVWGADVYNLPGVGKNFYEPLTWNGYSKNSWKKDLLYTTKLYATNMYFKKKAYKKVNNVLTWMASEYEYVVKTLDLPSATWKFFFYENQIPYEHLDSMKEGEGQSFPLKVPTFILGNSGTDTNNHVDAIQTLSDLEIKANLIVPVSYGSPDYVSFLKKSVASYKGGSIEFMDTFMAFNDYVRLLLSSDGLIMNHLRPQGYGNILMMMYLDKPVFLNARNLSIADLNRNNLKWKSLEEIGSFVPGENLSNRDAVVDLLSHERLLNSYSEIFS
jgi:dTDP-N-acetylfucosamine:lipid II N-acetylfucosaminyltransferase